jgi:hypothetical protein
LFPLPVARLDSNLPVLPAQPFMRFTRSQSASPW